MDEWTNKRTRTDSIVSTPDLQIAGYSMGERRTVIVVPKGAEMRSVSVLDSEMLGNDFRSAVRILIPPEALDAVEAWLDRPATSDE